MRAIDELDESPSVRTNRRGGHPNRLRNSSDECGSAPPEQRPTDDGCIRMLEPR